MTKAEEAGKDRDFKRYEKAKGNIETVFVAIADCADMVPVLDAAVAADPDNMDLKLKVLRLFNKKECTDNDLFLPVATAFTASSPPHLRPTPSALALPRRANSTRVSPTWKTP